MKVTKTEGVIDNDDEVLESVDGDELGRCDETVAEGRKGAGSYGGGPRDEPPETEGGGVAAAAGKAGITEDKMVGRAGNEVADRGTPQEVVGPGKHMVERLKFGSNLFGDKVFFGRSPCSFCIVRRGMGGSKCR